MSQIESPAVRARGRPPTRSDAETRHLIAEAARREFLARGFSATCMDDVARSAGVSKKTLYRLIPAKADLFKTTVTDRIARYLLAIDEAHVDSLDVAAALERQLIEFGELALSSDTINLMKLAIAEAERFPELASNFYREAMLATQAALSRYLARQCALGVLDLEDAHDAAGMLRGMMIMEPQRATMLGGAALPSAGQIQERARRCVRLFLRGCGRAGEMAAEDAA